MKKIAIVFLVMISTAKISTAFCQTASEKQIPVFNHTTIFVADLEKSAAFYEKVIGVEKIAEPFKDGRHVWFRIGEHSQLHVVKGAAAVSPHDINIHLSFSVASLPNFMKHLDAMNVKYGNWNGDSKQTQLRPDGVHQIYFQDPEGYWIEVNDDKY
ncbi:MAG TPA: VOC family protein [Puia sp.]|jgi:lactoylglutathione lyase|nr:VOC family protein [Puia sp.]